MINLKKSNGITLVVLAITIIVLIILAGIGINILIGDNGILIRSKEVSKIIRQESITEKVKMWNLNKKNNSSNVKTLDTFLDELVDQELITKDEKEIIKTTGRLEVDGKNIIFDKDKNIDATDVYVSLNGNTLNFYDNEQDARANADSNDHYYGNIRDLQIASPNYYSYLEEIYQINSPWSAEQNNIETVSFNNIIAPIYVKNLFAGLINLKNINNIENLATNNVTDFSLMFCGCQSLTQLDLSNFNTENVENMYSMFLGCKKLETVNISEFNTEEVKSMSQMFSGCEKLKKINVKGFDTKNVTTIDLMFSACKSLETIDISKFNTEKVKYMSSLFSNCTNLKKVVLGKMDTNLVENMNNMFSNCTSIEEIDLTSFDTSNVKYMLSMFSNCTNLKKVDLTSFNTENVLSMQGMFYKCDNLETLDLTSFKTDNVTNMRNLFYNDSKLTTIYVSEDKWVTASENSNMFQGAGTNTLTIVSDKPKVGDFINYKLGKWTSSDLEMLGNYYSGKDLPTSASKFGGFDITTSKDKSICADGVGTSIYNGGWRVFKVNNDGTIEIIHAGTPEAYYEAWADNHGYVSQYRLSGSKNPNDTTNDTDGIEKRNWKMYEDCSTDSVDTEYAVEGSARCVGFDEINMLYAVKNTGIAYWTSQAQDKFRLWNITNQGQNEYLKSNICYGVRPIVTLKATVKYTKNEGDYTHTTPKTAWNLE